MLPDPLSIVWHCADIPEPVLAGDEIPGLTASMVDQLVSFGLLRQADSARYVTCLDCNGQHVEEIIPAKSPDGTSRFYIMCPDNGRVEISRQRLLQYAIDYTPLRQAVTAAFSTQKATEEIVPGRIWDLGRAALAGKSRMLWMARGLAWPDALSLKERLPRGRSPVLFFVGQPPLAGLVNIPPESIIGLKTVVHIENKKLIVDKDAVECQLRQGDARQTGKKKQPKKRASRATAIDAIKRELKEHLRTARDHAHFTLDNTGEAALLPRPTQKQLAEQLNVHVSSVSRAINDTSDKEMAILWEIANDLSQVMNFKG
jgi:hypothetical protein